MENTPQIVPGLRLYACSVARAIVRYPDWILQMPYRAYAIDTPRFGPFFH